jgi:hypothetical protein
MADTTEKCAHPSCACKKSSDSKFCSALCEGASENPDIVCNCGHPACASVVAGFTGEV